MERGNGDARTPQDVPLRPDQQPISENANAESADVVDLMQRAREVVSGMTSN